MSRFSRLINSRETETRLRNLWLAGGPGMARFWRSLFFKTTFVAATGSHGKTTATLLLARILRTRGRTFFVGDFNEPHNMRRNILRARPWRHLFFVQEISGHKPGMVAASASFVRPDIGIVMAVGLDHRKAFGGSLEEIAVEKTDLVRALPASGLAVLNADDPLVAAMAKACSCRVVYFGSTEMADLRLVSAQSAWPDRLRLEVEYRGEKFEVDTQMVGVHWTVSVMAALLTALEMGVPKAQCVAAIAATPPYYNRMSVHPAPGGGWYVLDAFKSSFFGIEPSIQFLSTATAPRKTVLFGTISDYPGSSKGHYYKAARMGLSVADRVIFTGRNAERVRRLAVGEFAGRLFTAESPEEAVRLIEENAIPGELIYVKATKVDKLARLLAPIVKKPSPGVASAA